MVGDTGTNAGAPAPNVVIVAGNGPNLAVRALWFVFVGWWLSFWAVLVAVLLQLTLIGIPVAIWLINRIPQIVTLRSSRHLQVTEQGGVTVMQYADRAQRPLWLRALYFVLVGWWAASLWLVLAWLISITIILMPVGFWMFGATGTIQTLRR